MLNPAVLVGKYWAVNAPVEGWPSLGRGYHMAPCSWAELSSHGPRQTHLELCGLVFCKFYFLKMFLCEFIFLMFKGYFPFPVIINTDCNLGAVQFIPL